MQSKLSVLLLCMFAEGVCMSCPKQSYSGAGIIGLTGDLTKSRYRQSGVIKAFLRILPSLQRHGVMLGHVHGCIILRAS